MMALLESGRTYDIKVFGADDFPQALEVTAEQFLNKFMEVYKDITGITDSEYTSYKTYTEKIGNYNHTYTYFILPYINEPIVNIKEKQYLGFCCYDEPEYGNHDPLNNGSGFLSDFIGVKEKENQKEIITLGSGGGGVYDATSEENLGDRNDFDFFCNLIEQYPGVYDNIGIWMHIDTRFLDTHGFYTINFMSSVIYTSDETFSQNDELYFSPSIFVCDMVDQITDQHYDSVFMTNPKNINRLKAIGIESNKNGESQYQIEYFMPQFYTKNDNSLILQKVQFGRLKSNNIYITNRLQNEKIKEITLLTNSKNYKDVWLKNILYKNNKKFLIGFDNNEVTSPSYENINTGYVPVIEDKGPISEYIYIEPEPVYLEFNSNEKYFLEVKNPQWNGIIEYSLDEGQNWIKWDGKAISRLKDQSIYLRGKGNTHIINDNGYGKNAWTFTGKYCKGNIEALLDHKKVEKNLHPEMDAKCFLSMFENSSLQQPPDLLAVTLTESCYANMFYNCQSLNQAPKIAATVLAKGCCTSMFGSCKRLVQPPELPATILADFCYSGMFSGCESLTKMPELPATILADSCYISMFYGCKKLTQVFELPATTLAKNCYRLMFNNCQSLKEAPSILPATTLPEGCYQEMFYMCVSLTKPPTISATIFSEKCCESMFMYCYSLEQAPDLSFADTLGKECCHHMFCDCTSLKQPPKLPATKLAERCYWLMFKGCTALEKAPYLPAIELEKECYYYMFNECRNLKRIPKLPSNVRFDYYSCSYMFDSCSSLKLSESKEKYNYSYTITGTLKDNVSEGNALSVMFGRCPDFWGTPKMNKTYSIEYEPITT